MPKIERKNQKVFGLTASAGQIGQIGSFAAGLPDYSTDPDVIQALSNYLQGWYGVTVGVNSPPIQDMNALDFLITRQLAYIFQNGTPEYNAATTYYIGSLASDSTGRVYVSLIDDNLGVAFTNTSSWRLVTGPNTVSINPATQSPYTLTDADRGKTFLVNTANGAMTFNLPTAFLNFEFTIVDSAGAASVSNITIVPQGGAAIQGTVGNYVINYDNASVSFDCDATNWFITQGGRPVTRRSAVPAGTVVAFAGSSVPTGWLACDGSAVSQTTYAQLFANISSTWNTAVNPLTGSAYSAPGGGTFRVPDLRGAFLRGSGGGANAAGVTTSLAGYQANATKTNGITASAGNQSASHNHTDSGHNHTLSSSQTLGFANAGAIGGSGTNYVITSGGTLIVLANVASAAVIGNQNTSHNHTITMGAGDAETRPNTQGIQYIIKAYNES